MVRPSLSHHLGVGEALRTLRELHQVGRRYRARLRLSALRHQAIIDPGLIGE
jgi:hypothetical protein